MKSAVSFTDDEARDTIRRAIRLTVLATVLGAPLLWWKLGWQSAVLLIIGALISGSGLYEWLRLMAALMARMDVGDSETATASIRPLAPVLVGFFLRLAGAVAALYVSLNYLHGSVYALLAGLALGVGALLMEALRLVRSWTV